MQYEIRQAVSTDKENIQAFLANAEIDTKGIEEWIDYSLLVEDNRKKEIKGTISVQPFGDHGLLRAMVMRDAKEEDILFLVRQIIKLAKENGLKGLYCMVNNQHAIQLFELLGFHKVEKEEIPQEIEWVKKRQQHLSVNNPHFLYFSIENVDK